MTNIIANPGFDSGVTTPWNLYTNGTAVLTADNVSPYSGSYCGKLNITNIGTNTQIWQSDISLISSTLYRLTFAAYSTGGRDMLVNIEYQNSPYTNYGLSNYNPNLTTSWSYFTVDFTSAAGLAANLTRIRLTFQGYAQSGDIYYIDEFKLEKVKEITPKFFALF